MTRKYKLEFCIFLPGLPASFEEEFYINFYGYWPEDAEEFEEFAQDIEVDIIDNNLAGYYYLDNLESSENSKNCRKILHSQDRRIAKKSSNFYQKINSKPNSWKSRSTTKIKKQTNIS